FFSVTFLLFLFLFCFFSVLFIRLSFPTRRSSDLVLLDPADTVRELELVRWESRGPTIEPICDDLFGEGKLLLGRGISAQVAPDQDRKSTRLNSSHVAISYAVFCLKKIIKNDYV